MVAVAPAAVDLLLDLGVRPVLVPRLPGPQPQRWSGLETFSVTHGGGPALEPIVAAAPDLVINQPMYGRFTPRIERVTGAAVRTVRVRTIEDVYRAVREVAAATGRGDRGDELVAAWQRQITDLADAADLNEGPPPRVFAMLGGRSSFYAVLPRSYFGDLVRLLGGELVTDDLEQAGNFPDLAQVGLETVVARDPDVILMLEHGISPVSAEQQLEMLRRDPAWSGLRAVREGRVAVLPDDLYLIRPGAEPATAVRALADALAAGDGAGGKSGGDGLAQTPSAATAAADGGAGEL